MKPWQRQGFIATGSKRMAPANCAGVSLVELMVALTISAVAVSGAMQLFAASGQRFTAQHSVMALNQDVRIGVDVLCSELRLAGVGMLVVEAPLMSAEPEGMEFFANLSGSDTVVTQAVEAGRQVLAVEDGAGWPKGKSLALCTATRCLWNRLAADGRQHELMLASPMVEALPARSAVSLLNHIRYYVKRDTDGTLRIMRDVDGGANTLLSGVRSLQFQYLDRDGRGTSDRRRVVRVRIIIETGRQDSRVVRDVAIRM